MAKSQLNPAKLAEQLDERIPPGSDMILDGAYDPLVDTASRLAAYSHERLDETSRTLIHERMMLSMDELDNGFRNRNTGRILALAAVLAIVAGVGFWLFNSSTENAIQPLSPDEQSIATEETIETEEIEPTFTPTATDIPPTETPIPTETIAPTEVPLLNLSAYVQSASPVNVRAAATLESEVITTVSPNEVVTLLQYSDDTLWANVRLANGIDGWVFAELLGDSPIPLEEPSTDNTANADQNNNGDGNRDGNRDGNGNRDDNRPRPPRPPRPPGGNGRP